MLLSGLMRDVVKMNIISFLDKSDRYLVQIAALPLGASSHTSVEGVPVVRGSGPRVAPAQKGMPIRVADMRSSLQIGRRRGELYLSRG